MLGVVGGCGNFLTSLLPCGFWQLITDWWVGFGSDVGCPYQLWGPYSV